MGCGADRESAAETTPELPELTVPRSDTQEAVEPHTDALPPPTQTLPPETGPAPPPQTDPPAGDSPENDTPPPPDSPAERFEEFCNANPGACG
jgi:hypothetical protein